MSKPLRFFISSLIIFLGITVAHAETGPNKTAEPAVEYTEKAGERLYQRGFYLEAIDLWKVAAKNGDAGAAFRLGEEHFDAKVVERDLKKVHEYWEQAADANDPRGLSDLAGLYDYGNGVSIDREKAAQLYLAAAKMGFPSAMFNIASMLETGEGIKKDPVEAHKYYVLSRNKGFGAFASPAIATLEQQLSKLELEDAKKRAADFKPVKAAD